MVRYFTAETCIRLTSHDNDRVTILMEKPSFLCDPYPYLYKKNTSLIVDRLT